LYLDTSYIAKFYLEEPESHRVRELVSAAASIRSSVMAVAEFNAVLHRKLRESALTAKTAKELARRFSQHEKDGLWNFVPVTGNLLRKTAVLVVSAPPDLFLRTADAVHLMTAREIGEQEIWANDRHMLAAAPYFGLIGRSVSEKA
jgi:predicted nucleic acid-binding protein